MLGLALATAAALARWQARRKRRYVRLRVEAYRTDRAGHEAVVAMFEALHKRLLRRWWRRLYLGQPAIALEVHHTPIAGSPPPSDRTHRSSGSLDQSERLERREPPERARSHAVWLAVSCPEGLERMVETALQAAYPNSRLRSTDHDIGAPPVVLRLK
ncbi:MAG TPA: hypothetical protein VKG38_07985 [Solirubrobacteraceae bacterium]|nr:hypothetical protein [Solirubrobacteraceae bacterium]